MAAAGLIIAVLVSVFADPAVLGFLFFAAESGGAGLVDVASQTAGVPLRDWCVLGLVAVVGIRWLVWERGRIGTRANDFQKKIAQTLSLFVGWAIVVSVVSSFRWDEDVLPTLAMARDFLYYGLGLLGLSVSFDRAAVGRFLRWVLVAACADATIAIVGRVVDVKSFLPHTLVISNSAIGALRVVPREYYVIYLGLFVALYGRTLIPRWARYVAAGVCAVGTVAVQFRTFWLACAGAIVLELLYAVLSRRRSRVILGRVALVICVACAILVGGGVEMIERRVEAGGQDIRRGAGSISQRHEVTQAALSIVSEYPAFGIGFVHKMAKLKPSHMESLGTGLGSTCDVGYVDVLLRFGFVGSAFFWGAWFWLMGRARAAPREIADMRAILWPFVVMCALALPGASMFSWHESTLCLAMLAFACLAYVEKERM